MSGPGEGGVDDDTPAQGAGGGTTRPQRAQGGDGDTGSAGSAPPAPEPETTEEPASWKLFVRDVASSVLAVSMVGLYLFAIAGVWPPLVAVESGSMLPNMERNDLVFVMQETRFAGEDAVHGVVTADVAADTGYTKFNGPGDVIVYAPNGDERRTPIIHRAMYWVTAGENWCERGEGRFLGPLRGSVSDGRCVADHAGFITKGDANGNYDQATGLSGPVRPAWISGTAEFRIRGLGWIRLQSVGG